MKSRDKDSSIDRYRDGDRDNDGGGRSTNLLSGSGWQLPFRSSVRERLQNTTYVIPASIIEEEFRRLDITGEGRLTYLNLRSALELREIKVDDSTVKRWLRENDRGNKGYVDFSDYSSIYEEYTLGRGRSGVQSGQQEGVGTMRERDARSVDFLEGTNLPGSQRYGSLQVARSSSTGLGGSSTGTGVGDGTSGRDRVAERERMELLKK